MLSKIKLYAGIALASLIAFLSVMLKLKSSKIDNLETELESAEDDVRKVIAVNEANEQVSEVIENVNKAKEDSRADSISDVRARLLQSARDREAGDSD